MAKNKTAINPMTGEELKRLSNVLIYGITDEQFVFVHENLPNSNTAVIDCSDCFTDIIATAYITVIINPDFLTEENIEYFNELAEDVGYGSGTLIFTKRHDILNNLSSKVKYQAFADDFEFEDKIKYILLESSRKEKRNSTYSDTISQTIRVLSEIRKHPYITTAELAEKIERNSRTVQRYITTLNCAGEFIEYDRKKKGWFLWENKSVLWGDY